MSELSRLLLAWRDDVISDHDLQRLEVLLRNHGARKQVVTEFMDEAALSAALCRLKESPEYCSSAGGERRGNLSLTELFEFFDRLLKPRWAFGVAVLAIFTLTLWLASSPLGSDRPRIAVAGGTSVFRLGTGEITSGQIELQAGDVVRITKGQNASVSCRDGTQVDLFPGAEVQIGDDRRKILQLLKGDIWVNAVKQSPNRSMQILTSEATAEVLGTRFLLTANPGATWLAVEEGAVGFRTRSGSPGSTVVRPNFFSVATSSIGIEPIPFEGSARAVQSIPIPIDWSAPIVKGDGHWQLQDGTLTQTKVTTRPAWPMLWSTPNDPTSSVEIAKTISGNLLMEMTVEVQQIPDRNLPPANRWAGFACRVGFADQLLKFYFVDHGLRGKVLLSLTDTEPSRLGDELHHADRAPFAIGRYRMKMLIRRIDQVTAIASGKLWQVNEPEPEQWSVTAAVPMREPIHRFAVETTHCACVFREFSASLVRE